MADCAKRQYLSKRAARLAVQKLSARVRVYLCATCGRYHLTNQDKNRDAGIRGGFRE